MYELTVSEIARANPSSGGRMARKHATEMLRQGKARSGGSYFVGDKEVVNFKLDEDVDCWRWRCFEKINVNKGDRIKLVAQSDQQEIVRLDFIEFIPVKK